MMLCDGTLSVDYRFREGHASVEMDDEGEEFVDFDGSWHVYRCPTCGYVQERRHERRHDNQKDGNA